MSNPSFINPVQHHADLRLHLLLAQPSLGGATAHLERSLVKLLLLEELLEAVDEPVAADVLLVLAHVVLSLLQPLLHRISDYVLLLGSPFVSVVIVASGQDLDDALPSLGLHFSGGSNVVATH